MKYRILLFCLAMGWMNAQAGDVIGEINRRGELRCGVSEGIAGFSEQDKQGQWQGLDVDFCRAVAAAVLGDPKKVRFVSLKASSRFPALMSRQIDLLVRNTTWSFTREARLNLVFPVILFYDGQAFLVATSSKIQSVAELDKKTICIEKGTNHLDNLNTYFERKGWSAQPVIIDSSAETAEAFFAGRCVAYTADASQLAAVISRAPGNSKDWQILPERISKESLAPVVLNDDPAWATLVRWVLFVQLTAEEQGITRLNVDQKLVSLPSGLRRIVSGDDVQLAASLGVKPDWVRQVIHAVGNYGEMYDRNVGKESALQIDRGLNRLWTEGGLMYAPPLN